MTLLGNCCNPVSLVNPLWFTFVAIAVRCIFDDFFSLRYLKVLALQEATGYDIYAYIMYNSVIILHGLLLEGLNQFARLFMQRAISSVSARLP